MRYFLYLFLTVSLLCSGCLEVYNNYSIYVVYQDGSGEGFIVESAHRIHLNAGCVFVDGEAKRCGVRSIKVIKIKP